MGKGYCFNLGCICYGKYKTSLFHGICYVSVLHQFSRLLVENDSVPAQKRLKLKPFKIEKL